jgi:hypothetical protein
LQQKRFKDFGLNTMSGISLRRWSAWMPNCETPEAWRAWACDGVTGSGDASAQPSAREIPPLLRRRTGIMGRAALHVLSQPELAYAGQPIIFCSRYGEFSRSLQLQEELAAEGQVSPQLFSMAVHNASGGLFMMAKKAQAALTALAGDEKTALAGLLEAKIQLAELGADAGEGEQTVWLVYAEEPLPEAYRSQPHWSAADDLHYAVLLELAPGDDFLLCADGVGTVADEVPASMITPLDLLRFFLRPGESSICLSADGNWLLRRQATAPGLG